VGRGGDLLVNGVKRAWVHQTPCMFKLAFYGPVREGEKWIITGGDDCCCFYRWEF
jgi:hypothetical protein